jgi:hypothetical protein
MTNTSAEWRRDKPRGMHATVLMRPCGYHILLHRTGPNMASVLNPVTIGKSCVAYKVDPTKETMLTQAEALIIGVRNIADGVKEECRNL